MEEGDGGYKAQGPQGEEGEKGATKAKDVSRYRGKRESCRAGVCTVSPSSHKGKGKVGAHGASLSLRASTEKELGAVGASCLLACFPLGSNSSL